MGSLRSDRVVALGERKCSSDAAGSRQATPGPRGNRRPTYTGLPNSNYTERFVHQAASGSGGMLWISGPNVMKGYLNRPDLTAEVVKDGWYRTGDIAKIDADGFITITGRQSRFSKIGGEMVPHIRVEEAINQAFGASGDEIIAVVGAVSDLKKGNDWWCCTSLHQSLR